MNHSGLVPPAPLQGSQASPPTPGFAQQLIREPLFHFMLIGSVMFAVGSIATPAADRARVVDVTRDVRGEMAALFQQRFGHPPNDAELKPLVDQWIRTEVLYREAVALGLDRGDQGLRDRLISKMNSLVFQEAKPPNPTDAQLQDWFEAHRAQFDKPASVDFLAVNFGGANADVLARDAVREIDAGNEPPELRLRARIYLHRDQKTVDLSFGPGFMQQLRMMKPGQWSVAHGKDGWFVARVDGLHEAKRATLEENYDASVGGWRDDAAHALAKAALNQLASHYIIRGASAPQ